MKKSGVSPSHLVAVLLVSTLPARRAVGDEFRAKLRPFLAEHCHACHADGAKEGGLDLGTLSGDLDDEATFARWERIYDRVRTGEMPPADEEAPPVAARSAFLATLKSPLTAAHAQRKGAVLRRLNRREYENTLNDLFGTRVAVVNSLPEDGRSHEFDNVGSALGISLVHLQKSMEAAGTVLDTAIAATTERPAMQRVEASYANTREAEKFVGVKWKKLEDGAIVRFNSGGYPSGMMRGSEVRVRGRYRVRVTGYAYQSETPISFSVGGTSFARGSEKPIYGFFTFPPKAADAEPTTIEFEATINPRFMIQIEPHGIGDRRRYQRKSIDEYEGPGLAILKVTLEGPLVDEFPTRGHRLVFDGLDRREVPPRNPADRRRPWFKPTFEVVSKDEAGDARRSLSRVATAAFRRPVAAAEVDPYVALFQQERQNGTSFERSLRTAVVAILCSPKFLYLDADPGRLPPYQLASRLSYFLSRSTPDAELLRLAERGRLSDPDTLRQQTERLLRDPRFDRFLVDFTDNWLDLREMDFTAPDSSLFPEFDPFLRFSMPLETRAFVRQMLDENLPVTNVVQSDFAMLNSRLAAHYGLPPVPGATIRKVRLPSGSLRGGLLSQASVLKVTANGTNTSPVTRGAWVMERILGETPPPPPPGVPGVEPDIRGASTLRELLDKHRKLDSCRSCHAKIDPPGFALESFDPIGGFRDRYRTIGGGERLEKMILGRRVRYGYGPDVDSSGVLPGGRTFDDFNGFRSHLLTDPDRLARSLIEKLLTFATGRELGFSDRPEIERLVAASAEKGHRVRDLLHLVVQSRIFLEK